MPLWQLLGLLGLGALGVGTLAASSAKTASPASIPSPAPPPPNDLINRAFQAAMADEVDLAILQTFSTKLRAAGYTSYADAIDQRGSQVARVTNIQLRENMVTLAKVAP